MAWMSTMENGDIWLYVASVENFFFMLVLQLLLFKISRIRKSTPTETIPTHTELSLSIIIFWTLQLALEKLLNLSIVALRREEWSGNIEKHRVPSHAWRLQYLDAMIFDARLLTAWLGPLFKRTLWTSGIHLILVNLFDHGLPFASSFLHHPKKVTPQIRSRFFNFFAFMLPLILHPFSQTPIPRNSTWHVETESTSQIIRFQRALSNGSGKQQRNLFWNPDIDKDAMNEMKEILGPAGGFGELGFCVQKGSVKFECMGIGTSFILTFKLATAEEKEVKTSTRRRKKKI
jgi:hypothetical protein